MKKILSILFAAISCNFLYAQNVGIGKRILLQKHSHISEELKTVLIARMTTSQRLQFFSIPRGQNLII